MWIPPHQQPAALGTHIPEPHDIQAQRFIVEVAGADEIIAHARVREEVEPGVVGGGLLKLGRAEVGGNRGGDGEAGAEGGKGGDCVVVHPFLVFWHAEDGHDGVEGAEDIDFGEGEEVVGGWRAEDVALVGGFAEEVEDSGGLLGGGTVCSGSG